MTRLLADESLSGYYIHSLRQRNSTADLLTAHEVELRSTDDRVILSWAADHNRVLVSADLNTMIGFAYERIDSGLTMSGLIIVKRGLPTPVVVDDLLLILEASETNEWVNQIKYLPL